MSQAYVIAQLQEENQRLRAEVAALRQEREHDYTCVLSKIATVANMLLVAPDYTTVLPDVVQLLGEAVASSRCCVMQAQFDVESGKSLLVVLYESSSSTAPERQATPVIFGGDFRDSWISLSRGSVLNFLVEDREELEQSILKAQSNTSMLYVPIIIKNQCWGVIGFEHSGEEARLFNEEEIALLKVAASSIAGAIERGEYIESLRRSEALYKSLFEINNQGIYRWQLDKPVSLSLPVCEQVEQIYQNCYFPEANVALAEMHGFTNVEDVIGLQISNTHVALLNQKRKFVKDCVENGYCIRNAESEEIDINGQKHYFLNNVISFIENNCVTGGWGTQIDITELRSKEQALLDGAIERERLLQTITTIANQLLRTADYTTILPDVLRSLGEAAIADRCYLVENLIDPQTGKLAVRVHTEWCGEGITASIDITPEFANSAPWENFPGVQEKLIQGEMVTLWVDELPEPNRSELKKQGNIAMTLVPILVQENFWGVFGFDYCNEVPLFDAAHNAIFTIAVDSIAAAIEHQEKHAELKLIQQSVLEAEQEKVARLASINQALHERERLLETTATVANALLTTDNFDEAINCALQIIGESLDTDRVVIVEHFDQPLEMLPGWRILYEWDSEGTISQISHPRLAQGTHNGIEAFYESLNTGHSLSCLLKDMPEPFRSGQAELGVKSIHVIPIFIDGKFWGHVGFDDCREAKHRSQAELAALKIAANCVASAIERKRSQQALLMAEQQRAKELEQHNIELQQTLLCLSASEERYRTLMELSSEGIYRAEYVQPISVSLPHEEQVQQFYQQFRIVEYNQAFAQMYGYDQPNAMVGTRVTDVHIMDEPLNALQISEFIRSGHRMRNQETVEIDRFGRKHYFLNNGFSIIRDGYAIGGWGTQIDITQLRQRDLLLSVIAKVTKELLSASDIDVAICFALKAIGEVANISRILFLKEVLEPSTQKLKHHVVHEWTASGISNHREVGLNGMDNSDIAVLIDKLYQGKSIWRTIDDFPDVIRLLFEKLSIKSCGAVPIFIEGRYIGNIAFDDCLTARVWSQQEIDMLTAAVESIGAALHRQQLIERLVDERLRAEQERVAELAAANDALKRSVIHLTSSDSLQSFLNAVTKEAITASGATNAGVFVYKPSLHALQMAAFVLDKEVIDIACDERFSIWQLVPADITDAWRIMVEEQRIFWLDIDNPYTQYWPIAISWHRQMGHKTIVAIPMLVGEQALGFLALCFTSHQEKRFTKLEQCWTLTQHAALALRIAQLSESAKQAAIAREQEKAATQRAAQLAAANTALKKTLDVLATEPELDKSLGHVLKVTTQHLGSSSAAIWLYNQNTNTFAINLVYLNGNIIAATPENAHLLTNQWICGRDLSGDLKLKDHINWRVPVLYDVRESPKISEGQRQFFNNLGVQALLGVPLLLGSEIIGSFTVRFNEKRQLQAEELELTQALA
ncbi:hypothetical protein NIES2101_29880, partial [Calothrix sp. HK-06]